MLMVLVVVVVGLVVFLQSRPMSFNGQWLVFLHVGLWYVLNEHWLLLLYC
jgi:hypothetical protein